MPGKRPDPLLRWYIAALPIVAVCTLFGFVAGMLIRGLVWMTSPEMPVGGLPYLMAFLFGGGAFVVLGVSSGAGEFMRRIMTGGPLRPSPQYSYADSLVARGLYEGAIAAYRAAIEEETADGAVDAEPYLRIARVYRDHLKRPGQAIEWFREARRVAGATRDQINAATREMVDIYLHDGGDPARAIPELARLVEQMAGSKIAERSARKLAELKQDLAWTIKGAPDVDVGPGSGSRPVNSVRSQEDVPGDDTTRDDNMGQDGAGNG